jgi:hypothetical protein
MPAAACTTLAGDGVIDRSAVSAARLSARRSSSTPLDRNDGSRPNRRRCAESASALRPAWADRAGGGGGSATSGSGASAAGIGPAPGRQTFWTNLMP